METVKLTHTAALLELFRQCPNQKIHMSLIHSKGGYQYNARIFQLRQNGIKIEAEESETESGLWLYTMTSDNPSIEIKNGRIFDTFGKVKKEIKEDVKKTGFLSAVQKVFHNFF